MVPSSLCRQSDPNFRGPRVRHLASVSFVAEYQLLLTYRTNLFPPLCDFCMRADPLRWDAWSSFLAGVDVYAPSSTGSAYVAAPDFMDDVNVNRMLSFSDTPLHPGCGSASSMSSSPATSSRTHHQQTPLPHYDISVADNYMIMDRR